MLQAVGAILRIAVDSFRVSPPLYPLPGEPDFPKSRSVRFVGFDPGGLLSDQDGLLRCFKERPRALKMALRALQDAFKSRQHRDPVLDPVSDFILGPEVSPGDVENH